MLALLSLLSVPGTLWWPALCRLRVILRGWRSCNRGMWRPLLRIHIFLCWTSCCIVAFCWSILVVFGVVQSGFQNVLARRQYMWLPFEHLEISELWVSRMSCLRHVVPSRYGSIGIVCSTVVWWRLCSLVKLRLDFVARSRWPCRVLRKFWNWRCRSRPHILERLWWHIYLRTPLCWFRVNLEQCVSPPLSWVRKIRGCWKVKHIPQWRFVSASLQCDQGFLFGVYPVCEIVLYILAAVSSCWFCERWHPWNPGQICHLQKRHDSVILVSRIHS